MIQQRRTSYVNRISSYLSRCAIAGLVALAAACAGESPISPPDTPPVVATYAKGSNSPWACAQDSKFLGRIEISADDRAGTWWNLTRTGFDAAGITDYKAKMEALFGMTFATEQAAITYLIDQVIAYDNLGNGNGYVCAYSAGNGVRTSLGLPDYAFYQFSVRDDKHAAP